MTMAVEMKRRYADSLDMVFIYANTGMEHPETLDFLNRCDKYFDLGLVWLESVVHHEDRIATTHVVTDYENSVRDTSLAEEVITKFGIYNASYPHCTRELKLRPMESYIKSIGWRKEGRAVGIRSDEPNRVRADAFKAGILYPLHDWFPMTKEDVLDWWQDYPDIDLRLEEHLGNCVNCWKKTDKKVFRMINDPEYSEQFDFMVRMEKEKGLAGSNKDGNPRVFWRKHRTTEIMRKTGELIGSDTEMYDSCANEECGLD